MNNMAAREVSSYWQLNLIKLQLKPQKAIVFFLYQLLFMTNRSCLFTYLFQGGVEGVIIELAPVCVPPPQQGNLYLIILFFFILIDIIRSIYYYLIVDLVIS